MKRIIPTNWKMLDLCGATKIQKVIGIYELIIPGLIRNVEVKIIENDKGFIAYPNVVKKDGNGYPDGICGLGKSEMEALQDLLQYLMQDLKSVPELSDDRVVYRDEEFIFDVVRDQNEKYEKKKQFKKTHSMKKRRTLLRKKI